MEARMQQLEDENVSLRAENERNAEHIEQLVCTIRALKEKNDSLERRAQTLTSEKQPLLVPISQPRYMFGRMSGETGR